MPEHDTVLFRDPVIAADIWPVLLISKRTIDFSFFAMLEMELSIYAKT